MKEDVVMVIDRKQHLSTVKFAELIKTREADSKHLEMTLNFPMGMQLSIQLGEYPTLF